MHAVFFSDAHIRSAQDPHSVRLISWLDNLEVDRIYILGDLFDYWWEYGDYVPTELQPLFDCLLRITRRGIELFLLGGNRDFALGTLFRERVGAQVVCAHVTVLDGICFRLAHGDEADKRIGYMATRIFLRSKPFALLMKLLGPRKGYSLLKRFAKESRQHMTSQEALVLAQEKWACQQLQDVDVVVVGHSHRLAEVTFENGTLYQLGDWISLCSYLELKDGALQLCQFTERSNEGREDHRADSPHRQ